MKYRCCNDVIAAFSALNGLFWNWLFRNRPASSPPPLLASAGPARRGCCPGVPGTPMASPPGDSSARGPRGCQRCRGASPQHPAYTPRYIPTRAGPAPLSSFPPAPLLPRSCPAPAPLPPPVPGPARPAPRCQRACAGRGRHGSHSPASGRAGTPGRALPSRAAPVLCPHAAGVQSSAPQWFVIVFRRDEGKAFIHSLLWDPFRFR